MEEYSTQKVFELRKNKQLGDAYRIALYLYQNDNKDNWIQKAYAWVLIDIIKIEINNDLNKARAFFNQLNSIQFIYSDEIIEKQISFLQAKLQQNYQELSHAENISKNGNHHDALNIIRELYRNGQLSIDNHESYGWIIYRYLKNKHDSLNSSQVKSLFVEYLQLNNSKPSLLHSIILQLAIFCSQKHSINLYKFYINWGVKNLREEDKEEQYNDGKKYPSLLKKLLRSFIDNGYKIELNHLLNNNIESHIIIEILRESFFWKLINIQKNGNFNELWEQFKIYVFTYSEFGASHWHSEILKLANRVMVEENSWRLFDFFYYWNYNNFRDLDWEEEYVEEKTYKPLAIKTLSSISEIIKNKDIDTNKLFWLDGLYQIALEKTNKDIWILRNYAIWLNKSCKIEAAIDIYKELILDLNDQAYIWHEFASLIKELDIKLSISMLCKACTIQKNEDFLGQIHLDLASLLINEGKFPEAKTELLKYEKQRNQNEWKISEYFHQLNSSVQDITPTKNNIEFYKENILIAEDYIYQNLDGEDLIIYDIWKTKDNKSRMAFSNYNDIELAINPFKFNILKNAKVNDIYHLKLHYDRNNKKYNVVKIIESKLNKDELLKNALSNIAIVDHINDKKQLFHYIINNSTEDGIVKFNQTSLKVNVGDFIKIKYFKTFNKKQNKYKTNILDISKTEQVPSSFIKNIEGELSLKYKDGAITYSYDDIIAGQLDINIFKPDFAFVKDYYIPKFMLIKENITSDVYVKARAIKQNDKWSIFEINEIK